MKLKPFQRVPVLIASGVILIVCLLRLIDFDFFERLERITYDMRARQALKFTPAVATNLGFVFIDETSIAKVRDGEFGYRFGLYWPRQVYARLVRELATQGAGAVAFDVIFGELRPDHSAVTLADDWFIESDEFFALELNRAGNVILAVTPEVTPPELFLTNAMAVGDISTDRDSDGILRRAMAFRTYRKWHPVFLQAEAEYGLTLNQSRLEQNGIVVPRDGEELVIPLDENGNFDLEDFVGETLPPGLARWARPFTEERVWHMGVVLAAHELGLDLDSAEVDLRRGRIVLRGESLERVIPVDSEGAFYIDWCLPPNDPRLTQEAIHSLLWQHRLRLEGWTNDLTEFWRGKLAVVGSSAMGNDLTDRGATPIRHDTFLVSKHWNVANSIITGRFVKRSSLGIDLLLIVVMGTLSAIVTWRLRVAVATGVVALIIVAYVSIGTAVYVQGRYWIPMMLPVIGALGMMYVCVVAWRVVFEQAARRRVKSVLSTIVSPKVANVLLQAETLSLGGARREITVLFADVRGFTAFADASQERATEHVMTNQLIGEAAEEYFNEQARETLATINLYLGTVADTVLEQDGTLDKFIGDCVMAFWGAPNPDPKHASACVRAAINAQRAIHTLNETRAEENKRIEAENVPRTSTGLPARPLLPVLTLGTGINTGMATVGMMGSEVKTIVRQGNYTVFGHEVNLASRLESLSGRGRILISETTYRHLQRDEPDLAATCVALPPVNVKGIRTAVKVYEVPWRAPGSTASDVAAPISGETPATTAV